MKTREELNALKEELNAMGKKLAELTEEELNEVTGGNNDYGDIFKKKDNTENYEIHIYDGKVAGDEKFTFIG